MPRVRSILKKSKTSKDTISGKGDFSVTLQKLSGGATVRSSLVCQYVKLDMLKPTAENKIGSMCNLLMKNCLDEGSTPSRSTNNQSEYKQLYNASEPFSNTDSVCRNGN